MKMLIDAAFTRFGAMLYCHECHVLLQNAPGKMMKHPIETGWVFKNQSGCKFSGMLVKHPFVAMEVECSPEVKDGATGRE